MELQSELDRLLAGVEVSYGIKILYASVTGSRAFGQNTKDSDYDLRVIFVQLPWRKTLALQAIGVPNTDTVVRADLEIEHNGKTLKVDLYGHELLRHINRLVSSSVVDCEIVFSPLVVRDCHAIGEELRSLSRSLFDVKNTCKVLLEMAMGPLRPTSEERKNKVRVERVRRKSLKMAFRLLLMAAHVKRTGTFDQSVFSTAIHSPPPIGNFDVEQVREWLSNYTSEVDLHIETALADAASIVSADVDQLPSSQATSRLLEDAQALYTRTSLATITELVNN